MNSYDQETLEKVVNRVSKGELTAYSASKIFSIPRTTIENHVKGRTKSTTKGRPCFFSREQEENILKFINILNHYGYPPHNML